MKKLISVLLLLLAAGCSMTSEEAKKSINDNLNYQTESLKSSFQDRADEAKPE